MSWSFSSTMHDVHLPVLGQVHDRDLVVESSGQDGGRWRDGVSHDRVKLGQPYETLSEPVAGMVRYDREVQWLRSDRSTF